MNIYTIVISKLAAGPRTLLFAENQEDMAEGHVKCMLFLPKDLAFLALL